MECSCSIDGYAGDGYENPQREVLTNNSDLLILKCGECDRQINKGDVFEWYRGEYDGKACTHHTCSDCLSFRDNFFGDWTFEELWETFSDYMDDCGWQVPEKCLSKVTPAARAKICEMIEKYWEGEE